MFKSNFFSKRMTAVLILVCTAGLYLFAQDAGSSNAGDTAASLRAAEENILLNFDTDTGSSASSSSSSSTTSTFWLFVRMIVVLAIVIGIIYLIVWLLKKSMDPGIQEDEYLKKTASLTLAPGKSVQVITLGDQAWVLGVSEENVSLISEIHDKELIDAMNIHAEPNNSKKPLDFASMLANLSGSKKRPSFSNSEDFIRNRRNSFTDRNGDNK